MLYSHSQLPAPNTWCALRVQIVEFQYPLHLVSYCADDKSDKKMFTFIAKDKDSDRHHCFVFDSEKCVSYVFSILYVSN